MRPKSLLSVQGVSKSFGGVQALIDVSVTLDEGEILGVIGPNGAGKSTLAAVIVGVLKPDRGRISLDGVDITGYSRRRRARLGIAHTHQTPRVFPSLTVRENLELAARAARDGGREESPLRLAGRLGLCDSLSAKASQLSHGQRRLLEICMALLTQPRLLVMDEPTQGLAGPEISQLASILKSMDEGLTVMLIDHRVDFVVSLSTRVAVMSLGRIVALGEARESAVSEAIESAYMRGG